MKRFKTGENPIYDEAYLNIKNQSQILSYDVHSVPNVSTIIWDKQNFENLILEYEGAEDRKSVV